MGHGALVWCAGVGGLWSALCALGLLLTALISPYWALTTEPLVLDDPHPYYADLDYPLHLRPWPQQPQPQYLSAQQPQNSQVLRSSRSSVTPTTAHFPQSADSDPHLGHRRRRSAFQPDPLLEVQVPLARSLDAESVAHFWEGGVDLTKVPSNEQLRRDVNSDELSALKTVEQNFRAEDTTNTYVVVEESSDIVYKGVNISEWINPFSYRERFQKKTSVSTHGADSKHLGMLTRHSSLQETKREDYAMAAAAASPYPTGPAISAPLGPLQQLVPVFEEQVSGRSIPLKRPDSAAPHAYFPATTPAQTSRHAWPAQRTPQRSRLPAAHAYDWRAPATADAAAGPHDSRSPEAAAHGHTGRAAPQKTWPGDVASDTSVGAYQDDHDSPDRPDGDSTVVSTATFTLGLWSVCPSVNISSINLVLLAPRCAPISYGRALPSERPWGLPGPTPLTLTVVARIRISTPFLLCSCALLVLGVALAVAGRCSHHQAALLATLLFTLAGLSTGVAVVWFLSVITEEFAAAGGQGTAWSRHYSYSYGWALLSAAASAGASFLAALLTGHAHMAHYTPWQNDKLPHTAPEEGHFGRSLLMKCRSESHISSGRSFTSDTIRTYLTNDSRRQLQSQSASQGCFAGTASSHSFNDSSSLVDLTKPASGDALHEQEMQETTMEVASRPHCSRHSTPSRALQFRTSRTKSLSHTPEYVNAEDLQIIQRDESVELETNDIHPVKPKMELIRQSSVQLSSVQEIGATANADEDVAEYKTTSPKDVDSNSPASDSEDCTASSAVISAALPSPSSFASRTLPRKMFTGAPRLQMTNSFSEDHRNPAVEQDSTFLSHSFTDVEPPDLFNTNKKPNVSYSSTLPHGGKHVAVYSKRGNVRAATLTEGSSYQLSHV